MSKLALASNFNNATGSATMLYMTGTYPTIKTPYFKNYLAPKLILFRYENDVDLDTPTVKVKFVLIWVLYNPILYIFFERSA